MTRINTNISSLLAQQSLATSNANLQSALTQLSTGKKINSGADNPAGLIASQELAGDIANTNQAVSNSQMASSMISTADSSLAQVSSLLTTIQGLVNQAASTGNMSATAIAANQEVVDSSLDAISRIASTTSFQGQNLLDGSLAFKTTPSTNFATNASSLQVSQANLGTSGQLGVDVNVATAATGRVLKTTIPAVGAAAAPAAGTTQVFANASTTGTGSITITAPRPERSTTASTCSWKPMPTSRPTIRRRPTTPRPRKSSSRSTIRPPRSRTTLPPRSATSPPSPP